MVKLTTITFVVVFVHCEQRRDRVFVGQVGLQRNSSASSLNASTITEPGLPQSTLKQPLTSTIEFPAF